MSNSSSYLDILFTALSGIDGSVMPIIWFIANSILTVTFLWGIYDAFVRGGDVRSLGITMLKYVSVALILLTWSAAFRNLTRSFDYVSNYIYGTSGLADVINAWTNGLATVWDADGKITLEEFKAAKSDAPAADAEDEFKKLDADGDGKLSYPEYSANAPAPKAAAKGKKAKKAKAAK